MSGDHTSAAPSARTLADVSAIILAGGLGTRLGGVLPGVQKVVAPVAGRPFAAHLLRQLAAQGVRHVVLALGHHAEATAEALEPIARALGITLDRSVESAPLGTGGSARLAMLRSRSDPALVMNGDSLVDVDLTALLDCFRSGGPGVVTLVRVDDTARYGRVELDAAGRIAAFHEKRGTGPGLINAGVYLLSRAMLLSLPENRPSSLERDLLARADRLLGLPVDGRFLDIGTPESLVMADEFAGALPSRGNTIAEEADLEADEHAARLALVLERNPEAAEPHHPPNQDALFGPGRADARLLAVMERPAGHRAELPVAMHRVVADAALLLGRLDDAVDRYRALSAEGDPVDLRRLGFALFAAGAFQDAVEALGAATRADAGDWLAWRHLGGALFALGRLGDAIASYRTAIARAPQEAEAWRNLARCLRARGDDAGAVAAYGAALTLAPERAETYRNLGHIHYYAHRLDAAASQYRRAATITPGSPLVHFSLGCVAFSAGDVAEAGHSFAEAERLDPEHYPTFGLALVETARLAGESVSEDRLEACRRRLVRHFRKAQARHYGIAIDAARVRCLWPARFPEFFQAQGIPVEEYPAPAPPVRSVGAPWHVAASVARAEEALAPLRLVRRCRATLSLAEHCSSASLITDDAYLAEMVYERPATGPHGEAFYFPPDDPLAFPVWTRSTALPTLHVDTPATVIGGSFNYGHFLLDTLGKLMVAERFGDRSRPVHTFPLHGDFGAIARLLFPDRAFHDMAVSAGRNAIVHFADAEVPGRAPYHTIVPGLARRAEQAGLFGREDGPEWVYLSRRHYRPLRHRVDNDEEVSAFLEARGFTVMFPEKLDFRETVRVFRSARTIVSPIGAQYGNVVFCRPGARYIELTPTFHRPNPSNQHYDCISHYAGVDFIRLWGEDTFLDPTDPTLWTSRFDITDLASALDNWPGPVTT